MNNIKRDSTDLNRNSNNKGIDESLEFLTTVHSKNFQQVLEIARKVAKYDTSVLITGETGVGKEVVARYIHMLSSRSQNSLLSINCGALPETLLESELFGHKAGSFTGAINDRVGLFEHAARGTILLDEIGDITLATQVKLLRVLQEHEILRIGENIPRKVDTRIIAATNRDLDLAVSEGRFRVDLLYRLRVIEIDVPPLRDRHEDIVPLLEYLSGILSKRYNFPKLQFTQECIDLFMSYSWPGNVRELQNAIERAAVLSNDGIIKPQYLLPQIIEPSFSKNNLRSSTLKTLADIESEYINEVLQSVNGNRTQAAKILGIGTATLWRKLKT